MDHLGQGANSSSLAQEDERDEIHFGADDNASGVAAMLEIAQYLAAQKAKGKFASKRDVVFAGWSGEEIGLIGSSHYVKSLGDDPLSDGQFVHQYGHGWASRQKVGATGCWFVEHMAV